MRLALLAGLAAALAACASEPAGPVAPPPAPPSAAVRIDSLLIDEPELGYTVRVGYPQIDGDSSAVAVVNEAIRDSVTAFANSFRPSEPPERYDSRLFQVEVTGTTEQTFVDDHVLSTLVDIYAYTGGAHGNTFFLPLTYDLESGDALAPSDLFRPGAPWGDTLAAWTERGVLRQLANGLGTTRAEAQTSLYTEGFDPIRSGDVFATLGPDSLTVHVPPYQVSAYAAGSFAVAVPYRALAAFARPGSVLARLAER